MHAWLRAFEEQELPPFPGGWKTYDYKVLGHEFPILAPAQPDALLDLPEVLEANRKDDYMPYWGFLWPTSLDMSKAILQSPKKPEGDVLELGTGVGLVGIAALRAGWRVVLTDYDETSVRLALLNAERNGFAEPRGCLLDWRTPFEKQYDLILGCDLIYEQQTHEPMLTVLRAMLSPTGECWLADPGRHQADHFLKRAKEAGFKMTQQVIQREPFPSRPAGTTNLWILKK